MAAVVIVLLAAASAMAWYGARSTERFTEAFDAPIDRVVVDVDGRVEIAPGGATEVTVERTWFFFGAPSVEMGVVDGELRIVSDCGPIWYGCSISVDAVVPASSEVMVDTSAGAVEVAGTTGGVDLTTSAGGIDVDDVSGPAILRTSAGPIRGTVTGGDVDAETSAGSIDLRVSGEFSSVSAVTSAGSVDLEVPDEVYDVDADTAAGNVTIDVRTDPDADRSIVAHSSAGSVTIDRFAE